MPGFSVVIRTYTQARWEPLRASVASVQQQTLAPHEIVLVVDHNPTLLEQARAAFPGVHVVDNPGEVGSSGAWNAGVRTASSEFIAFIDDDAAAAPDWLEQLAAGYGDPRVVGVGGEIVPVWLDGRPKWFPDEYTWVVGCTYRGLANGPAGVRNLIGCNMSFRRDVFHQVGFFLGAENGIGHMGAAPIGCDETEFCIRVRQRCPDKIMLYRPEARVYHRVPASRTSWQYFRSRCYYEGRSKSRVAQLVGGQDGLESERAYTLRTLPLGVVRGLSSFVRTRHLAGLGRATAIVAGLAWAAAGYAVDRIGSRVAPHAATHSAGEGVAQEGVAQEGVAREEPA